MSVVYGGGCVSACVHLRTCVHVRKYVRNMHAHTHSHASVPVPMFSNDSCTGLGYDSGVSRTILGNMITHAHSIHGPSSYFQRVM